MGKLRLKVVRLFLLPSCPWACFRVGLRVREGGGGNIEIAPPYRKGIRLIFLNQDADIGVGGSKPSFRPLFCLHGWGRGFLMRQRKRIRRRQREPWEELSFLFNGLIKKKLQSTLESDYLEIGYNARQSTTLLVVSGALSMALENPKERMIFVPGRTDNRSRSPR